MLASLWERFAWLLLILHSYGSFISQLSWLPAFIRVHPIIKIKNRRFRILRQLGEGGYAYVYLAKEVAAGQQLMVEDMDYAIKKMLAPTRERLDLVQKEIQLHASLSHPCILRLLDHDIICSSASRPPLPSTQHGAASSGTPAAAPPGRSSTLAAAPPASQPNSSAMPSPAEGFVALDMGNAQGEGLAEVEGACDATAYMLFPAYTEGTLTEEVGKLLKTHRRLTPLQVLDIFRQVCQALHYLHETKGLAHRDIKPHNVLIRRTQHQELAAQYTVQPLAADGAGFQDSSQDDVEAGPGVPGRLPTDAAPAADASGGSSCRADETHVSTFGVLSNHQSSRKGQRQQQQSAAHDSYQVVVMDFGSAVQRHAPGPASRRDALALQDEAESHCTATYRAPELFDVQTGVPLDFAKCDVWAAGCTLYHMMYGASPFQKALDQPGGSAALAALSCSIPWPRDGEARYPEAMHGIVQSCLVQDPRLRPSASQLVQRAAEVMLLLTQPTMPMVPMR